MNKRTSAAVLGILILFALVFGFILVNRGDGPVMGMIISDRAIANAGDYKLLESSKEGVYLLLSSEFNCYKEKYITKIPSGKDAYFNVYFAESPKGSTYTAKWTLNGNSIKESSAVLPTDKKGVLPFLLEESLNIRGKYTFEIYNGKTKIFNTNFEIE